MNVNFWLLTGFAAVTAFICRALPFVFKDSAVLNDPKSAIYRFLSYSTQAMMGVIIYDIAFRKADALTLIERFEQIDLLKLCLLIFTFIVVARTKKMLPIFFGSLAIYFFAVVYQYGEI